MRPGVAVIISSRDTSHQVLGDLLRLYLHLFDSARYFKMHAGVMDSSTETALTTRSRWLSQVLRDDYDWTAASFISGAAPLNTRAGRPCWRPHRSWFERLRGVRKGQIVPLEALIEPGAMFKFCIPNDDTARTQDFSVWRGYFEREAVITDPAVSDVLDRWLIHTDFEMRGFDCLFDVADSHVRVRLPSIVFYGAAWIRYIPRTQVNAVPE